MPSLRITAGTLRGRRIPLGLHDVRPTSERARQAYFNIVGERADGAHFLDLFAGSGVFALEALSRGAASATAVDISRKAIEAIRELAASWNIEVTTVNADALAGIKRLDGRVFDLVYADPPYDYPRYDQLLESIDGELGLAPRSLVAIEHKRRTEPFTFQPGHLEFERTVEHGEVWIDLFERGP